MIKVVYSCLVRKKHELPDEGPDVITISEAAKVLGVTEVTLRRWDASGKFKARRHPISGYRIYRVEDVMRLRKKITGKEPAGRERSGNLLSAGLRGGAPKSHAQSSRRSGSGDGSSPRERLSNLVRDHAQAEARAA